MQLIKVDKLYFMKLLSFKCNLKQKYNSKFKFKYE